MEVYEQLERSWHGIQGILGEFKQRERTWRYATVYDMNAKNYIHALRSTKEMCDRAIDLRLKMGDLPFAVDKPSWLRKVRVFEALA
jgi:hypothetical protein